MNMEEHEIFTNAIKRAKNSGVEIAELCNVVVFLEKEIDSYRNKIEYLEHHIEVLKTRMNAIYGVHGISQLNAVRENTAAEIIKALADNGYNTITINCYKDIESEV